MTRTSQQECWSILEFRYTKENGFQLLEKDLCMKLKPWMDETFRNVF